MGISGRTSRITVALAGNPNSGKTSIFNGLVGVRQHVGNYPGVTVEKKHGTCVHNGVEIHVVDLPGTYSLTAYSIEEIVARDFVVEARPDVVLDIIDASNLERNLYLTTQLIELGTPLVLAFNMSDVAETRGYEFDLGQLSSLLGAPIVPTVGHKAKGVEALLDAVIERAANPGAYRTPHVRYGPEIEEELAKLQGLIEETAGSLNDYNPRWLALKLLENDGAVRARFTSPRIIEAVERSTTHLERIFGDPPEIVIADRRYGFISGACQESVRSTVEARHTMSDKIDVVLANRALGFPIFLALMYGVFYATFTLGAAPMGWIEQFFAWLGATVTALWPAGGAIRSLLVDGVIGGVGSVVVFLPNILILFLAIALLEDTGYMARAAFVMDGLMHKIGLHGKSFIPMLIGFGCSVPAILATRTLEHRRDRFTTILVVPLMSCGARLTIYALLIPAFFPERWRAPVLWIIYLIGVALAVLGAKLLRATLFRGETTPFVMELPPYRLPTLKGAAIHMWERSWLYLKKAGTIILAISIVLWALTSYPKRPQDETDHETRLAQAGEAQPNGGKASDETLRRLEQEQAAKDMAYSFAGRIGRALEPALKPMGFDWRIGTALIGAFAAKEVFVAQLGIVYAVGADDESSDSLRARLQENYSPLVAFCIMLFCLVGMPCMATVAVTKRETGSWRWALFQMGGLTALAYVLTTVVYQVGRLVGIGVG